MLWFMFFSHKELKDLLPDCFFLSVRREKSCYKPYLQVLKFIFLYLLHLSSISVTTIITFVSFKSFILRKNFHVYPQIFHFHFTLDPLKSVILKSIVLVKCFDLTPHVIRDNSKGAFRRYYEILAYWNIFKNFVKA